MTVEKHSTYFNMLDALKEKGCPLCRLSDKSAHSYFDAFLFENVTDREVSKKLRASGGFCREHSERFLEFNDTLGAAIVYESLIYDLLNEKKGSVSLKSGLCPACAVSKEAEDRHIKTFETYFAEPEFAEAYLASGGFCISHLKLLLPKIKKESVLKKVIEKERQTLEKLHSELLEFLRKNDYRFSKEEWGAEKDSWRRAIGKFVGERK